MTVEQLPRGWDALPAGQASKRFTDYWVQQRASAGLLLPSVVASEEENLLLNAWHPRFRRTRVPLIAKVGNGTAIGFRATQLSKNDVTACGGRKL